MNGPIAVVLKLDDPISKKTINARACPHKIFKIPELDGQPGNHLTVLVGYGQVNGINNAKVNYWVIANSWGGEYQNWGNHGFFAVRMTDKLSDSFSQIEYIECKHDGSFINPGLDINEENLKNATQHNLSQDVINKLDFRDAECSITDNTKYATGGKENTDMLQNFYDNINLYYGKKIDSDTFQKIPEMYKHNFSWADPQQNPYKKSFVSFYQCSL